MVNANKLKAEMREIGDIGETLAKYLDISQSSLSAKINEAGGRVFNHRELARIKQRYGMSNDRFCEIFFAQEVSKKDTKN